METSLTKLEHHGIKGQKWGVRKSTVIGVGVGILAATTVTGILPAAAIGAGAGYVAHRLGVDGDTSSSQMTKSVSTKGKNFLSSHMKVKI